MSTYEVKGISCFSGPVYPILERQTHKENGNDNPLMISDHLPNLIGGERERQRQRDRQRQRQRDRQTDRQAGRQADRQTDIYSCM